MRHKMILIADSGSTKTDWSIIENEKKLKSIQSKGINPFFQTEQEIVDELAGSLLPEISDKNIQSVVFYGTGCTPEKQSVVRNAIARVLTAGKIEINTDLLAAAHAVCGKQAGLVCILGTGSNSCYYDGTAITANVSPLGFILGDEGSGAALGKSLVGDILKNQLPEHLKEAFSRRYSLTTAEIIDRVYRKPFPNRFLAGFSPFLLEHIDEPQIRSIVETCFRAFFRRNVMQYDYRTHDVHFVGSVAFYFQDVLKEIATECGIKTGKIMQQPMEGLIAYHTQNTTR